MTSPRRLLLIVPFLDRGDVGEALSNYHWAVGLAGRYETTVLTLRALGADFGALPDVANVVTVEEPWIVRAGRHGPHALDSLLRSKAKVDYSGFHRWCVAWIDAHGAGFDVVHQIGPLAPRFPSPFARARLPEGVRRVIGPVGGGLPTPPAMRASCRWSGLRDWFVRPDSLLGRRAKDTYESADLVIGVAPYMADVLKGRRIRRFAFMPEMGLEQRPVATGARPGDGTLRLIYVGRLIRTKGLEDGIAALARVGDVAWRLTVVGAGPRDAACRRLAASLGVADRIDFRGRLAREATQAQYRLHDVMLFPSFREPGGNAVMEAMAAGLPVVTTSLGGPGYLIDDSCGVRVDVREIGQFHGDLAAAIRRLAADPDLRARMGACAVERAAELGWWPRKIEWMARRYDEL